MGALTKIFGTYSEKQIKKIMPTVRKIEALSDTYKAMSDEELRGVTAKLKARLSDGETLDDILPDAFAACREAADRVLGKRPFTVQLIGGIILHQGRIAEMKTGEGKTLVATLPAYLNGLSGEGVHVVTVNEYLAARDSEEMGRVYEFLGLSCGLVIPGMSNEEKKKSYAADITYGTNNEFGFDYLRDNMVLYKERMVQRGHVFAIVDEVDSILIDEARTPLIISGAGTKSTDLYDRAEKFVRTLRPLKIKEMDEKEDLDERAQDYDYVVDEKAKTSVLTKKGIEKAEKFFGLENYSDAENATLAHHVNQAIKAHGNMHIDDDYVVKDGEVIIVDAFTGRLMHGRRYSDGLHQAIEAKEGVKVEKESRTLATITFQNYFRLYGKLSGMTGTALTEEDEFREIYQLDVIEIPTNKPMIRLDHEDAVYTTLEGKYKAIIEQIRACHEKEQPVLVGTVSIERSELLSRRLKAAGIKHTVLNAKYHEREAEIVAQAGRPGAVTISTNMAGRGTDIMLGGNPEFLAKSEMRKEGYEEKIITQATGSSLSVSEEVLAARAVYKELYQKYKEQVKPDYEKVVAAGGLFILGTERHESRRIDNQLRGRSGRQGDPGESKFYLSFEDELMRLFGNEGRTDRIAKLAPPDMPIEARLLTGVIEGAQKRLEGVNFERRKNVLMYDDVMNQQRTVIYNQRREVLEGIDMREKIVGMIHTSIENAVQQYTASDDPKEWELAALRSDYMGVLCGEDDLQYSEEELSALKKKDVIEFLQNRADEKYHAQEEIFGAGMRELERIVLLRSVDEFWMDHIDAMDELRGSIGLHAYAQRNPITEYRIAGADMFDDMVAAIREQTVRGIFSAVPAKELKREQVAKITSEGHASTSDGTVKKKPVRREEKVGRNDPCPCGSGKKYKKCCGRAGEDTAD